MDTKKLGILEAKAEYCDQIIEKYKALQENAGFYSRNWVELAELIETAIKRLKMVQ